MRELSQVIRRSLVSWNWVDFSQGIREVSGEYVCFEGTRDPYLQYRKELMKNKDCEAGVNFWYRLWEAHGGSDC